MSRCTHPRAFYKNIIFCCSHSYPAPAAKLYYFRNLVKKIKKDSVGLGSDNLYGNNAYGHRQWRTGTGGPRTCPPPLRGFYKRKLIFTCIFFSLCQWLSLGCTLPAWMSHLEFLSMLLATGHRHDMYMEALDILICL